MLVKDIGSRQSACGPVPANQRLQCGCAALTRHTLWLLPPLCALQARPNSIAVFVPSEITTYCFYPGLQRDYMVSSAAQPSLANHPSSSLAGTMRSKQTGAEAEQWTG